MKAFGSIRRYGYLAVLLPLLWLQGCQTGGQTLAMVEAYGDKDYVTVYRLGEAARKQGELKGVPRYLHAWALFQLQYYPQARAEFAAIHRDKPSEFHGWLGEAWIAIKQRRLDDAERFLKKAEQWMGQHQRPMWYAARGWVAFYRNRLDEAERLFDQTEESLYFPDAEYISIPQGIMRTWNTLPWVGRGWVAVARGRPDEARKQFSRGLEHDATCHLCFAGLAAVAESEGKIDKAIEQAVAGLKVSRHDPELVGTLNRLLARRGDLGLSSRIYEELVKTSDGDPMYRANLAWVRVYQGRLEEAHRLFRQALEVEPGLYMAKSGLQRVRKAAGQG